MKVKHWCGVYTSNLDSSSLMSFLRSACDVNRKDGESNDEIYEILIYHKGAKCGVVKCIK